ncbi:cell cycle negative regulator roughex [Drosophila miranda]|uniref:cell cycle negative regulator roughex n=1 Tax=Drosophila miranda TaxID=7229 RepID=UPI0007E74841|nr:cell cycle negative regulator roughex [Drosophila miranda]
MNPNGSNQTAVQPSARDIVQNFIDGVDTGYVRADLADDCILSLFGSQIRGVVAVTGFLRTQIWNRFKHIGFEEARPCTLSKEVFIKEWYGPAFERVRRRMHEQKERARAISDGRRIAVADSDVEEEVLSPSSPHLATPPRPAVRPAVDMLQYVEARGVMENVEGNRYDGGIQLYNTQHVLLTLGYRQTATANISLRDIEVCLAIYENYRTFPRQRQRGSVAISTNPLSDDEAEEAASYHPASHMSSVRRILFAGAESGEPEDSVEPVPVEPSRSSSQSEGQVARIRPPRAGDGTGEMPASSSSRHTTRKRRQQRETEVAPKRPGRYGMRF